MANRIRYTTTGGLDPLVAQRRLCKPSQPALSPGAHIRSLAYSSTRNAVESEPQPIVLFALSLYARVNAKPLTLTSALACTPLGARPEPAVEGCA